MKNITLFCLISLLYSCEPQKLTLIEQFFEPDELLLIAEFQRELEQLICQDGLDADFTCYNDYFNQVYDPQQKRNHGTNLISHKYVEEMNPATFDLLFHYTAGQEKKSYDAPRVDRKNLNLIHDGKFMNFADTYGKQSNNKILKGVWEKSDNFRECNRIMLSVHLFTNSDKIDYSNEMDRLIYSILYTIIDYNTTFMY